MILRVLDQSLDTATSEGRLLFSLLGAVAEFEADIRQERQRDGVSLALQKGVKFGRRNALNTEQVRNLRWLRAEEGFSIGQLQDSFQISRSSFVRSGMAQHQPWFDKPGSELNFQLSQVEGQWY